MDGRPDQLEHRAHWRHEAGLIVSHLCSLRRARVALRLGPPMLVRVRVGQVPGKRGEHPEFPRVLRLRQVGADPLGAVRVEGLLGLYLLLPLHV